jgi:cell fate regulator YaaT (PSP1 superfamily)
MKVIGVKFRKEGKIYDFDPGDLDLKKNDLVIVDTEHGQVLGQAVTEIRPASGEGPELKPVLRKASPEDLNRLAENRVLEQTAGPSASNGSTSATCP